MIQYHVYPGGKKRIVTFSYDDGHENDARLIELFNYFGIISALCIQRLPGFYSRRAVSQGRKSQPCGTCGDTWYCGA